MRARDFTAGGGDVAIEIFGRMLFRIVFARDRGGGGLTSPPFDRLLVTGKFSTPPDTSSRHDIAPASGQHEPTAKLCACPH